MPDLGDERLRWARFCAQRLSSATRLGPDPAAVARAMAGAQAQSLSAGCLSLRVRSVGLTRGAVHRAIDQERTLAWTWLMRGTLHICAAEDVRWMLSLFGPNNLRRDARRRAQVGLDDATCEQAVRVMRRALDGGPLTRHQLRAALAKNGVRVNADPQTLIHLIGYAAHAGVLVVTTPVGRDNRFALLEDWIPAAPQRSTDEAEAELARRYFGAFGPATVGDFMTWSGLPAAVVRRAAAAIADELREVAGDAPGLLAPAGAPALDAAPSAAPTVRLLPHWDTYLLGYRSRDLMIEPEHAPRVIGGGWFRPTVCVDGYLEGSWELRRSRSAWTLEVEPFEQFDPGVVAGIHSEAAAIEGYLGDAVSVMPAAG